MSSRSCGPASSSRSAASPRGSCSAHAASASASALRYDLGGAVAIPLPHPSGASSWLNVPANRARVAGAVELIRAELAQLGGGV